MIMASVKSVISAARMRSSQASRSCQHNSRSDRFELAPAANPFEPVRVEVLFPRCRPALDHLVDFVLQILGAASFEPAAMDDGLEGLIEVVGYV